MTRRGAEVLIGGNPYAEAVLMFLETLAPAPANDWELRAEQKILANFQVPKTFEDLQQRPVGDTFGYEKHHIVEHNDSNIAKDSNSHAWLIAKFGRDAVQSDGNVVWIPRLKHEDITSLFNSSPDEGQPSRRVRDHANTLDFAAQRQLGLDKSCEVGVLK